MNTPAIQTHSLTKIFTGIRGATRAVDGLSISVPEGSIYGLLGRNSAGKTTTIRMLMGLARPTSGSSRIFGLDPTRERERVAMMSLVGYVPEDKTLLGLTARTLFELNRCFYPETWSDDLARKAVERLELPIDTPFLKLSMGNKTKSALITAIAQRSRLLILDEPTAGLDPVALDALLRLLVEDCTSDGRTILVSSHQLAEIEQISDHIGILDRGTLLLEDRLDQVLSSFRRVTATGAALPKSGPAILSVRSDRNTTQYVLRGDHGSFIAALESNGATIADSVPLSLNEIFLELCRGEKAQEPAFGEVLA
ncbi:MAG: ABC transporter ATP-binding protein [Terracidiphilus sp.]|jgi:ABC-2 type transport system ATP-binding protein